jgi:hypothetical protein
MKECVANEVIKTILQYKGNGTDVACVDLTMSRPQE